jgi:hypothetical protein
MMIHFRVSQFRPLGRILSLTHWRGFSYTATKAENLKNKFVYHKKHDIIQKPLLSLKALGDCLDMHGNSKIMRTDHSDIPSLATVLSTFTGIADKSAQDVVILLKYMDYYYRPPTEILEICKMFGCREGDDLFTPFLIRSMARHEHVKPEILFKSIKFNELPANVYNSVVKAYLTRALVKKDRSQLATIESQLTRIDEYTVDLLLYAHSRVRHFFLSSFLSKIRSNILMFANWCVFRCRMLSLYRGGSSMGRE